MLSNRQQLILDFIYRFNREQGYPPTIRDIVNGCNISSTSVVDYNLKILEKLSFLRRHREVSRGIALPASQDTRESKRLIPIIGLIAAGTPIPVPTADTWNIMAGADTIEVTEDMTRGHAEAYALKVTGLSMIDALINDGDIVLMEYTNTVENGQTAAVWLKAEKEATLKKVYRERGRIRLQPANSEMKPIYVAPDNIEIQGRVISVIRHLL